MVTSKKLSYFLRFESKTEMQKSIESTKFEPGNTMTAMAMNQALKSFKKLQRKDSETPRVWEQ